MNKQRPMFNNLLERFIWAIKNNSWSIDDQKFADRNKELYELALKKAKND